MRLSSVGHSVNDSGGICGRVVIALYRAISCELLEIDAERALTQFLLFGAILQILPSDGLTVRR